MHDAGPHENRGDAGPQENRGDTGSTIGAEDETQRVFFPEDDRARFAVS